MTEQMKHEIFAQNLKNMGIAKRQVHIRKRVKSWNFYRYYFLELA